MNSTLIKITLGEYLFSKAKAKQSFNNDRTIDRIRNSFYNIMNTPSSHKREIVPSEYLHPNVHHFRKKEIYKIGDKIVVGRYCDHGIIVPRTTLSIIFNRLYNCSPLISLIRGDKEYISFLHTWAIEKDFDIVDKQVKHWMETVSKFGEISETIFAPRKCKEYGDDTEYRNALDYLKENSKKTILLNRDLEKIEGMVNKDGVYFKECGYHLWDN